MNLTLYKSPCPDRPASELKHVEVPIVCRSDLRLQGTHYSIAALGPGASALPRQIAAARGLPATFSYCLPPEKDAGAIFFGARSYPYKGITMHKVPMNIPPDGSYTVELAGVEVSNAVERHTFPSGPFSFTVSSRERSTRLPPDAYNYIFDGISKSLSERGILEVTQKPVGAPREPCYSTSQFDVNSLDSLKIKLVFSNQQTMELKPAQYFFEADFLYCLTISTTSQGPAVIGYQAQLGKIIEFDLEKETLGFSEPSPQSCFVKFA